MSSTSENAAASRPEEEPKKGGARECPSCHKKCASCEGGPLGAAATIETAIAEIGFAVSYIFDSKPPFAYSTGMTETYGLPEFVIVGFLSEGLIRIICAGVDRLAREAPDALRTAGREIMGIAKCASPEGAVDTAFGYAPVSPRHFLPGGAFPVTRTLERYGPGAFELRQIVVPAPDRKLPWHEGYDPAWAERVRQLDLCAPQ